MFFPKATQPRNLSTGLFSLCKSSCATFILDPPARPAVNRVVNVRKYKFWATYKVIFQENLENFPVRFVGQNRQSSE